ncbi:MAG: hypothetical protein L6408_09005 [Nanoarchaeota archaeon]|nr:hypothetical protein [Nanoarchaeota archaeon]
MTELIACLSTGKGTWGHVSRLIQDGEWEKVFLITNEFGKENFTPEKEAEFIVIDASRGIIELRDEMYEKLKEKVQSTEVGINIVSGTGKEHTALVSAVLKLGIGIRLVALTKDGVQEV